MGTIEKREGESVNRWESGKDVFLPILPPIFARPSSAALSIVTTNREHSLHFLQAPLRLWQESKNGLLLLSSTGIVELFFLHDVWCVEQTPDTHKTCVPFCVFPRCSPFFRDDEWSLLTFGNVRALRLFCERRAVVEINLAISERFFYFYFSCAFHRT